MKVAIVLNTSWNIYNFRLNFIKKLLEHGHEVHTIAPHDDFSPQLQRMGCVHHDVKMDSRGANVVRDTLLFFELRSIYKQIRPDIILHYTIKPNVYGTLAAATLRIPAINNVCGLGTVFLKENLVSKVAMFLYRVSFRYAKKVFFQNPDDRTFFIEKKLVPPGIADLLPGSGIDLQHFQPVPFRRNATFTFLLVSRLITDKGILEYIEAVKKLRQEGVQARFQLLGPKDPKHKRGIKLRVIEEWIKSGTVEYLGTTQDVRHFMSEADCIVLPSYREGTPRTLLEAASISKPIIATNVPGCKHVVEHNANGLLCEMKNVDDLASQMKHMASLDAVTLQWMGENGRKKVEREFDETIVIKKYLDSIKAA